MAVKSILKPDGSIAIGIATMVGVTFIYNSQLPAGAIIHNTNANNENIDASRKKATWTAAGVLSIITLLTRDVNVFILGGVTLAALDFSARHANASNPATQELVAPNGYGANPGN